MVSWTRRNVTLCVHCLTCSVLGQAVSWLRRIVGLSPRNPLLDHRPVYVGFTVDKVALQRVDLSLSVPFHQPSTVHSFIYHRRYRIRVTDHRYNNNKKKKTGRTRSDLIPAYEYHELLKLTNHVNRKAPRASEAHQSRQSQSTYPVNALYCLSVSPRTWSRQVLIHNVGWVSSDVNASILWYAAVLLDEPAVTCYVALPPAGAHCLAQFQINLMISVCVCLSPYVAEPAFIKSCQMDRQLSEDTEARRGHKATLRQCSYGCGTWSLTLREGRSRALCWGKYLELRKIKDIKTQKIM